MICSPKPCIFNCKYTVIYKRNNRFYIKCSYPGKHCIMNNTQQPIERSNIAMIRLYDLCVATRRYTHNGEEKAVWLNIGSILQGDKDPFMMLKAYFNPAGITRKENSESITVSMFTPKDSTYDYDTFCWTSSQYAKLYDLCAGTRRYTSNGQEKTAWENVGAIMMGDKHPYLMLKAHFNPAAITRKEGSESIVISLFRPKREGQDSYGGSNDGFDPQSLNDAGFNSTVNVPF